MTDTEALPTPELVWLNAAQVRARYGGTSKKWLERKLDSDPDFPRPVRFNDKMRYFSLEEIEAYEKLCVLRSRREAA